MKKQVLTIIFSLLILVLSISTYSYAGNNGKDYVVGIAAGTRAKEIKEYFKKEYDEDIVVYERYDNVELPDDAVVKTGAIIVKPELSMQNIALAVTGDINGDGRVSVTDLFMLKNLIIDKMSLIRDYRMGADTNLDKKVTITDMAVLKNLILRTLKENVGFSLENIEDKVDIELTEPIEMDKLEDFEIQLFSGDTCNCMGRDMEETSKFYSNKDINIKAIGDGKIVHVETCPDNSITHLVISHGIQNSGAIAMSEYWIRGKFNIEEKEVHKGDIIATVKGNGKDIKCVLEYALITSYNENGVYGSYGAAGTEVILVDQTEYMYEGIETKKILCEECEEPIKAVKAKEVGTGIYGEAEEDDDYSFTDIVEIINDNNVNNNENKNTNTNTNQQQQQQQQRQQ